MMLRSIALALIGVLATAVVCATQAQALDFETVKIKSTPDGMGTFTAELLRPPGAGPLAAIVALHGCGGLFDSKGELRSREADWAQRLMAAGYVVLLPDSFSARGLREICTASARNIFPDDRAEDAAAAALWLSRQSFVDKSRLGMMGWSHGAMTVLWTVRAGFMRGPVQFKTAVAFYPGCREVAKLPEWRPAIPLTLLIGGADDWTQPGPCLELSRREGFRFVEYPDAYHGFDAPDTPVRVRKGLGAVKSGQAHVGTNPEARKAAIEEVMRIFGAALRAP
jgi:dienelactone hydrolase